MRLAFFLLLIVCVLRVHAQDGVHRCVDADGRPLFTDQPCAALNATPVATPEKAPPPGVSMTREPTLVVAPPPVLCAGSVGALKQSVLDAFGARDPNRLAGLMVWDGAGRQSVVANIRALGDLMKRPLLDISEEGAAPMPAPVKAHDDIYDLSTTPGVVNAGTPSLERSPEGEARALVVRTAGDDGSGNPRESRFPIVRRSGCLWLRPRGE
ncbi:MULTISPECIES: DUF4124 domain-containing protein [Dyella]|uniref:DUF4124 domain-containing protein n=2 Tax=Dyella TaxID=231454 RepID=A0A4R0YPM8_9GAMM|nr:MULTISPECIES: DUF4124 domain-containing protein [Dyella]TBR36934.1 DUF4124 domain-containing protein [Dyella terrae]TCI07975.1 DUF4124 domain-containing protein [Dyella soli]